MPDRLRDGRGLGLRNGVDRRTAERRRRPRAQPDRRRRERRHAFWRSLFLTAVALASYGPHRPKATPKPRVTVSNEQFSALASDRAYEHLIKEAAAAHDIDPELIRAVMRAESAFDPWAVSRAGAMGLMQLMPALALEMGIVDPFDPRQNIMAGARYLRELLDRHHGNVALTLASYNAGPGAVARYKGVPPFKETRNYVASITELLADARREAGGE